MILALDLGTKTGWALSDGGRVESGVQLFDVKRGESPGMRYLRFNRWLEEMLSAPPLFLSETPDAFAQRPRLVVYEAAHHRGGSATEIAAGFATRVQEACARVGINHASVHSATLKKWTTGAGNSDKSEMGRMVRLKGWADHVTGPLTDDEADALALLQYAMAEIASAS